MKVRGASLSDKDEERKYNVVKTLNNSLRPCPMAPSGRKNRRFFFC